MKGMAWHALVASFHKLFHLFRANIPDESGSKVSFPSKFQAVAKRPRTPYCIGTLLALFLHLLLPFESEDIEDWLDFHSTGDFSNMFFFGGDGNLNVLAVSEFCWCPNSNRTDGTWWQPSGGRDCSCQGNLKQWGARGVIHGFSL